MKRNNALVLAAIAVAASACTEELSEQAMVPGDRQEVEIVATAAGATKTVTDENGKVSWLPADEISVFTEGDAAKFVNTAEETAAVTVFRGSISYVTGANGDASVASPIYGLYPYNANAALDGGTVTTTLNSKQAAVAGTFADDLMVTAAKSDNFQLAFYNVTGGVRFSLTQPGITSVTFTSNAGEALAGKFSFGFEDGVPAVKEASEPLTSVTVTCPEGFEAGKYYYIVTLPATLKEGFTLSFAGSGKAGKLVSTKENTISRGTFATIADADKDVTMADAIEASYIANRMMIYDDEEYEYTKFGEYVLSFKDGDKTLSLALNVATPAAPLAAFPTGEFTLDPAGAHVAGTFTASEDESYTTAIITASDTLAVVDGTVKVTEENGVYTIKADLIDENESSVSMSLTSAITVKDESLGATASADWRGQYNTYFGSGANQWEAGIYISVEPEPGMGDLGYFSLTITGPTGEVSLEQIPAGTYTYAEDTYAESNYNNGTKSNAPGTFNGYAYLKDGTSCELRSGTITISYDEAGNMCQDIDVVYRTADYDYETYDYVYGNDTHYAASVNCGKVTVSTANWLYKPVLDTDNPEFKTMQNCTGIWFGTPYTGLTSNVLLLSFSSVNSNYTVNLPLVDDGSWTFEGNGANANYCVNHAPQLTYNWIGGYTPAASCIGNVKTASYAAAITSDYTGTRFAVCGGYVKIESDTVEFNLTAKAPSGETITCTGSLPYSVTYGFRNRSTAKYQAYMEWVADPNAAK